MHWKGRREREWGERERERERKWGERGSRERGREGEREGGASREREKGERLIHGAGMRVYARFYRGGGKLLSQILRFCSKFPPLPYLPILTMIFMYTSRGI